MGSSARLSSVDESQKRSSLRRISSTIAAPLTRRPSVSGLLVLLSVFNFCDAQFIAPAGSLILSTSGDSFTHAVEGFGTGLNCRASTCPGKESTIVWMRDEKQISEGTKLLQLSDEKAHIEHNIFLNHSRDCGPPCGENRECPFGQSCLDNTCCYCTGEEFTLFLKNVTTDDGGHYRCQVKNQPNSAIDFDVDVVESGLTEGFHKNFTYNFTECCRKENVRPECQGLCNIGQADVHRYDFYGCKKDIPAFVGCASNQGNQSHLHCCKLQLVPPFCWDFCTGQLTELKMTHRLCTYWLPEILECYEHAFLPYPGPPENLIVNSIDSHSLQACWKPPTLRKDSVDHYTVYYKELPRFPFFSGAPFMSGSSEEGPSPPGTSPDDVQEEVHNLEVPIDAIVPPGALTTAANPGFSPSQGGRAAPAVVNGRSAQQSWVRRPARDLDEDELEDTDTKLDLVDSQLLGADPTALHFRFKRQTWTFVTFNSLTNETRVHEFPFSEVNTTDTCTTIKELNPSTQYFIYVTAHNSYGSSLPSVRSLALTPAERIPNGTLPDIASCCRKNNVQPSCIPKICDLTEPPSAFGALDIALNCRTEFYKVSPCLADQRNHTACCRRKGVSGDCLKLCSGTPTQLGIGAVVCLSLDMQSVYQCLRQGYVTHPSPPQNVSVVEITTYSARVKWAEPRNNSANVVSYSLYYRENGPDKGWEEKLNVNSPFVLINLLPNTNYLVYLIANGANGSSLPSTAESFFTMSNFRSACPYGSPLRSPDGTLFPCSTLGGCPRGFGCRVGRQESESMCCPTEPGESVAPVDIGQCCMSRGVSKNCQPLCTYNTTADDLIANGVSCVKDLKHWVECGTDGRDHRPCCLASGVKEPCLDFCSAPLKRVHNGHVVCLDSVDDILKCVRSGILKLPGPPLNFRLTSTTPSTASFAWDKPRQNTTVKYYTVYLRQTNGGQIIQQLNTSDRSLSFTQLTKMISYEVNAISFNEHGSSAPSTNITFSIEDETQGSALPNADSKPEPPYSLEVVCQEGRKLNVTWSWSGKSMSGRPLTSVVYNVSYFPQVQDRPQLATTQLSTSNKWILLTLPANTQYNVYVAAINQEGGKNVSSFPSEIIDVFSLDGISTSPAGGCSTGGGRATATDLKITLDPQRDLYRVDDRVNITCTFTGVNASTTQVTLSAMRQQQVGLGRVNMTMKRLTSDVNQQRIICTAITGQNQRLSTKVNIKVTYAPRSSALTPIVKLTEGTNGRLECRIRSFPAPSINWFYTNPNDTAQPPHKPVNLTNKPDPHLQMMTESTWEEEEFKAFLSIDGAKLTDTGTYHCKGCNPAGCAVSTVYLVVEVFPAPLPPKSVQQCCRDHGVREECRSACTSDIRISSYENNTACMQEIPKLFACARDGKDHRSCCIQYGVRTECLSYCNGQSSQLSAGSSSDLLKCSQYSREIIACLEEKQDNAPSAPRNVKLRRIAKDAVNVSWDAPERNAALVEAYVIYYRPADKGDSAWLKSTVRGKTWKDIGSLNPLVEYEVVVAAGGQRSTFAFAEPTIASLTHIEYQKPANEGYSAARSGAAAIAVIFCLLFVALVVLLVLYVRRKSVYSSPGAGGGVAGRIDSIRRRLPLVFGARARGVPNGAVAFENPGYDKEAQVHGLPGDDEHQGNGHLAGSLTFDDSSSRDSSTATNGSWQSPRLEAPVAAAAASAGSELDGYEEDELQPPRRVQKGGSKYTQLT